MSSLVMYGNEFPRYVNSGLTPQSFRYRLLAEGDSWMDRSSMFHTSLLQELARQFDGDNCDVLIINLSMFGDTISRMGDRSNVEFQQWISTDFNWKFDAVLLSASGNDFIDAALEAPGQGILRNLAGQPLPAMGRDCILNSAVANLVDNYLTPHFSYLYNALQASRCANLPLFLNDYDTPTARNVPAFPGGRSWLYEAYTKNSIAPSLWPDLTAALFTDVRNTLAGWAAGRPNIHCVPTNGSLIPAQPGSTGSDGDWLNEIHPNESGWKKLAAVWKQSLYSVLQA